MTDLLDQVRAHNWWYSDTNLATQLIDEVTKLRTEITVDEQRVADLMSDVQQQDREIDRLRGLLREYADVVRLVREGKPVPLAYLEDRIREALGDE